MEEHEDPKLRQVEFDPSKTYSPADVMDMVNDVLDRMGLVFDHISTEGNDVYELNKNYIVEPGP